MRQVVTTDGTVSSRYCNKSGLRDKDRRVGWRWCGLLAVLPVLGACHDDRECYDCTPLIVPEVTLGLVAADFQQTGKASVIATSTLLANPYFNRGNLKLYTLPAGATPAPLVISDGHDPLYLASADLNGDNVPDVVSASYSDGALAVFLNTAGSPGTFGLPILLPSRGASQLAIGDINGDGLPDIVSADFNVSLFVQLSAGSFASPLPLYAGGANWVALGDLNGDGRADVALTDAVGVKLLFQTGAAGTVTFGDPVTLYTEASPSSLQGANLIAITDVDADGFNDLVLTDPGPAGGAAPTVVVLRQDPANPGTFLPAMSLPIQPHSRATSILATDLDGDGRVDIAVGGSAGVSVLRQDPANPGSFLAAASYDAPYAYEIAAADVDGDGRPDLLVGTGVPAQPVNNIVPNIPGVLLQSATVPGTFGALQSLP